MAFRVIRRLRDLLDVDPSAQADGRVPVYRAASGRHEYEMAGGSLPGWWTVVDSPPSVHFAGEVDADTLVVQGIPIDPQSGNDGDVLTYDAGLGKFAPEAPAASGAPTDADYLVGTANGLLSNEIAVGATPGGELGGTWASPTVDATHSGSSHASVQAAAEATAAAALATHEADTTAVHGIADTTTLYRAGGTDVAVVDGGTGASSQSGARTNLGLVIGTDVEAHDPDLTTIAGLTPTNDDVLQRKAGAWTNRTIANLLADLAAAGTTFQPLDSDLTSIAALSTTSFGRGLLALADAAALRSAAALVIGTDVQAYDAELAALAGLTSAADKLPYFTGAGTAAVADFTSAGRALVDDASASAQRTTLGIAAAAGGAEWTVVRKAADESVSSNTTLQDDDELFFTPASGTPYQIEIFILFSSPLGGGTPDLKWEIGEDATQRGVVTYMHLGSTDAGGATNLAVATGGTAPVSGSATTARGIFMTGFINGNGGTFRFRWAQNTSGSNAVTVKAGSKIAYRTFT